MTALLLVVLSLAHASARPAATPEVAPSAPPDLAGVVSDASGVREGLVVAPLAGGPVRVFGSVRAPHAWSTIKPVIAVAVAREHPFTAAQAAQVEAAIANSDNAAAEALFADLGPRPRANDALDAALELAGDSTPVNRARTRPEFSTYGQTEWPLAEAGRFYRALANGCLAGPRATRTILGAMGSVTAAGGSTWGLAPAGFAPLAFKDGLGPESGLDDYTAEQYGIVGAARSSGYVIGVVAETGGGSAEAEAAVTELATRAERVLRRYHGPRAPGVRCP